MNSTCCTPAPQTSTQAAPTAGVTESLQKPRFAIDRQDDAFVIRVWEALAGISLPPKKP